MKLGLGTTNGFAIGILRITSKYFEERYNPTNTLDLDSLLLSSILIQIRFWDCSGKMESFFKVTSQWTQPPGKEEIARVFADHDMKVVGPPLEMK